MVLKDLCVLVLWMKVGSALEGLTAKCELCFFCLFSAEEEQEVKNSIFQFGKELIGINLTETELALLCAVVLVNPGKEFFPMCF